MNLDQSYHVVAVGRKPLFICKAVPNLHLHPSPPPHPQITVDKNSNPVSLFKIKQQFRDMSHK